MKIRTEHDLMKYRLANDALGIALWDMDVVVDDPVSPDNKITWSQDLRDLLGFSDEHDFPNTIDALASRFHPDDSEKTFAAFAAHFNDRSGETPYNIEYRLMHKNGEYRWFHGFGDTMRDSAGVPLWVAGAVLDIDERKKTQNQLIIIEAEKTEALNTMKRVLDELDAIIYVTAPATGEILFMNNSMRQHYGIDKDLTGQLCYKTLQVGMTEKCDFCPCIKLDEDPDSVVVWERTDPFTQRIHRKTDRYIQWPDGKTVHLQHAVDITDLVQINEQNKQITEELKIALLEVKEANNAKDEFLSRMSHEMLTPMNGITGMTQVLKMKMGGLYEYLKDDFEEIEKASSHLLGLINDLLDITEGKDGSFRLLESVFSFSDMLQGVVSEITPDIEEKRQTLDVDIEKSIPDSLLGDGKRLSQVISHILTNANKFTHDYGEIKFDAQMIGDEDGIVTLQVSIRDNGIGVSEEEQGRIFSIFEQVDGSLTRKVGGTGLGLSLAEHIVELMGGKIWVESEPGKGSTFTFTSKLRKVTA